MSKKHKNVCTVLNYIEHLLTLVSALTLSVSISDFDSSVNISVGMTSSALWIKICAIFAGIKTYKPIIKKKKKKHDKKVLWANNNLSSIKVLVFKALIH